MSRCRLGFEFMARSSRGGAGGGPFGPLWLLGVARIPCRARVLGVCAVLPSCDGPSFGGRLHPEGGEAGDVVGSGQELEVGGDLGSAAHPGAATAVLAAHEVGELAFDLWAV